MSSLLHSGTDCPCKTDLFLPWWIPYTRSRELTDAFWLCSNSHPLRRASEPLGLCATLWATTAGWPPAVDIYFAVSCLMVLGLNCWGRREVDLWVKMESKVCGKSVKTHLFWAWLSRITVSREEQWEVKKKGLGEERWFALVTGVLSSRPPLIGRGLCVGGNVLVCRHGRPLHTSGNGGGQWGCSCPGRECV